MSELDAIVKGFVVESVENLDRLEHHLIDLERNPSSADTLAGIFRSIHTIKGAAGFLGLPKLTALAHTGESLLARLRDGAVAINPPIANGLLSLSDCIRQMLSQVEQSGAEGEIDGQAIIDELTRLQDPATLQVHVTVQAPPDRAESPRPPRSATSVRVSVEQLDALMNLVGELVLARNEIVQRSASQRDDLLLGTSQRLNAITTQLQEGIMKTRMQPIDTVWSKLPRVVRDTAQCCGKLVRLEMEGKDTELDRTLIEAIQDPLTHVVRNCIDHGLEAPDRRIAAGKAAEGRLSLRAFHEGGQVTIEIADDGAGIDVSAIKRKAVERGLITPDQSRLMSDQEAMNLVFLPGLSTAAKVTSISGRGVGMDVVKTNIEQIGGKVSLQSQPGVGTTLRMRIPLTLAIMTALTVTNGEESYVIPQVHVLELVRLDGADANSRIEMFCDVAVYRLRGELLPLVWLDAELAPGRSTQSGILRAPSRAANIVVLQADQFKFGLVVDGVTDTQEIVVKPLGRHVRGIPIFAGATIMGNGRVVLILDIPGLAVRAHVLSEAREKTSLSDPLLADDTPEHKEALLLFAGPTDARMAVRLSQITRLEEFNRTSLERVGGDQVVQYFGDILPLAEITSLLPQSRTPVPPQPVNTETIQALVYSKNGRQVGVVVDRILDTIEETLMNVRPPDRPGGAASIVIDGRVTEILDLDALCDRIPGRAESRHAFIASEA